MENLGWSIYDYRRLKTAINWMEVYFQLRPAIGSGVSGATLVGSGYARPVVFRIGAVRFPQPGFLK